MPSSQILLLMYLALATSEQFDITTIYRFQRAVIIGFSASPSSFGRIEECDAQSCGWEKNGWRKTYTEGITVPSSVNGLMHLTTSGKKEVKLQPFDPYRLLQNGILVTIKSSSKDGEALLYFSSESELLVVVINFKTEYRSRSARLYRCTSAVASELIYSDIQGRCSTVNSQVVTDFYLEESKTNIIQLRVLLGQLEIADLTSPKLGLVKFSITGSELANFNSIGASHSSYRADILYSNLMHLTTPGTREVKLQSLDPHWLLQKGILVTIESSSEYGEALLYFSSESEVLVVVIPFKIKYNSRSARLYRCTSAVASELIYSDIQGRCSTVNSQVVTDFYLEESKTNIIQLRVLLGQLEIADLTSPKLGLVKFSITGSELAKFNSIGASHSSHHAEILWAYSSAEFLSFELDEQRGEFTSESFHSFDSAICIAITHFLKPNSDASIAVKIVLNNETEVSVGTSVAANNTKQEHTWKTQLFYRDADAAIGNGSIKVIAKKSSESRVLIKSIRMCNLKDGNSPATINRESSIEVHSRNNALGLPLMTGLGKILNANVAVDLEPCAAIEDGCNWELTDYAMIEDSSPLTLPGNEQSFSPTSAQASLVSQKFIPKYKKICVSVVSTDLTSSCKLEIVKIDGRTTQPLTQIQETSLGNGWNIRIYHGDTENILSHISIKLSECAFASLNRPRIQRIAGCNNEDLDDDVHIISSSSDSSYMEYVAFEAAVKESSVDVSDSEDCLNGGLYDDKSHSCVCPPGFTGSSCNIGCGPDRYGSKCDGRCSRTTMGCMEMKLCRPKLGCSCAPGIKGILCDIPCSEYEYGAGCSQKCGNCERSRSCDIYTGKCFSGCKDGFHAPYCQKSYKYLRVAPEVEVVDFYTFHVSYDISTQYMEGVGKPRFHQLQFKDEMGEWKELSPVLLNDEDKFETNVTNLVPNMEYQIRAVLLDEDGNSYQGKDVPITKAFTKCAVPNEVNYNLTLLSVTESAFEVEWQYDDNMTWCKLLLFEVELKMGWKWQRHSSGKENYSKCYNLLPGETYQIRVRAMTTKGLVAYSKPFTVVTQDEAPEAVTALKVVSRTHSELELDWKEPFGRRGKIQGYKVSYKCVRLLGCSEVTCNDLGGQVEVVAPSVSLHGLQPHAQYSISISAKAAVYGTETFILAATDMTVPELAPTAQSDAVVSTNSSLSVKWKCPENCTGLNGYPHGFIYELYVQGNSAPVRQGKTQQAVITFTELTPHMQYSVKVYLHTSGGKNLNHPLVINASTRGSVPEKVQHLTVYKTGRRLIGLQWAGPREAYGDIHSFTISYGANNQKPIATVIKPTSCFAWPHLFCHTLNALKPDTEYIIQVRARNTEVAEDGAVTEVAAVTKEHAPLAPGYIRTVSQGETDLIIEWGLPRLLNGVLRSFLVNVEETDSHNISSCCSDFPIEEIPTRSEQGSYQKQLNNLKPASTYTVSVSGKTIALGPAVSMTTHTRPSVPSLEELVIIDSDEGIISESPSLKIKPLSDNHKLVSGYLLLVIPNSSSDNVRETSFQDDWLEHELKQKINGTFYVAAEFDQATLEEQSEIVLGTGNEVKNGKWSEVWDPILQDGQQYRFGLVVVLDYCGVFNIGYTETAGLTTGELADLLVNVIRCFAQQHSDPESPKNWGKLKIQLIARKEKHEQTSSQSNEIMMYELKEQDEDGRFESKFEHQDVGLIEAEEKCLQPLLEVKSEPEEMKKDFLDVEPKYGGTIKVEEEETNPLYQLVPIVKDQIQVLDEMIKNENLANESDKIKFKEDQKFISGICSCNTAIHKETRPFSCEMCGKYFNQSSTLKKHRLIHTGNRPFSCAVCGKYFNDRNSLKRHLRIHTGDRPFSCAECGKSFNRRSNLKRHLFIHTGSLPFSCEECGKSFNHRSYLKKHLLIHSGNLAFSCEVCGKSFNCKGTLKTHLLIHTGNHPFPCEVCGKSFNCKGTLKTHLLIHTGKRPFSCEVCGKSFYMRSNLKDHLIIHTGNLPFSCEECGKSFNRRSNLKTHLLIHTGNRPFSCEGCKKSFNGRSNLKKHMFIHTGNRPFSCDFCGKSFNDRSTFKRHLLIHTGNRQFSCEVCGKCFNEKCKLKAHMCLHK